MSAEWLAEMRPVGLAEMVDRAALQTRVDRKYLVPLADLGPVFGPLGDDAQVLDSGGRRAFGYESVYFDTPDLASYYTAAQGRRRRFKIRTRTYLDTNTGYLEVKTRGGRSTTVKDRFEYRPADSATLTTAGREYVDGILGEAGITGVDVAGLAPVLTTRYNRTTLLIGGATDGSRSSTGDEDSRATIDTALTWQLWAGPTLTRPGLAVVETKSGSRASAVDRLLWRHGHRPATISKYGTGMAALRPELAANKWGRVLRHTFDRPGRPGYLNRDESRTP